MDTVRKQIYSRYNSMVGRCYRIKDTEYFRYGGRGINVCREWENNFELFLKWAIDSGFKKELTIDRINTNGNYEPSNCRWVSQKEQANNTRRNRIIVYDDNRYTMEQAALICGISSRVLQGRLNMGWSDNKSMDTPYCGNLKGRKPRLTNIDMSEILEHIKEKTPNSAIAEIYNITEARVRQIKIKNFQSIYLD